MKDPIIVDIPVIFEIFKSKPYPISQDKCLISFKIWKLKDQHTAIKKNFPKKDLKITWKSSKLVSMAISKKDNNIIITKLIIPTILCAIDKSDDICHL